MKDIQNVAPILQMINIIKDFPGVRALKSVNIELKNGEILGLLGENGAGKSTLVKILSGEYSITEGEILIEGKNCIFKNAQDSLKNRIRTIYQEITTFEPLTVAENVFAGEIITNRLGLVNWKAMSRETKIILKKLDSDINPIDLVQDLNIAGKQIVEIAKAIRKKAKILVMDEPTSALSEKDVFALYKIMRSLKNDGVSIIFISHKIEEIFEITDRVIVLRDGVKVGDKLTKDLKKSDLISLIIGRDLSEQYPKQNIKKGKVLLEVENLSYSNIIKNVSLNLREGEILALFGLFGSGIHELLSVLFGVYKKTSGNIYVKGKKLNNYDPAKAKKNFIGCVPFDKKLEGLAVSLNIKQNITSSNVENIGNTFIFNKKIENDHAKKWFDKLNVKAPSISTIVESLSGGNQQKIVIAKWMERDSKILLMNEPTRGIDVGAKREVYLIAENLCKDGAGVIMTSSELLEVMGISDRVIVMKDGRIVKEFKTQDTSQEEILHVATI